MGMPKLEEKGKYATIIGLIIAVPSSLIMVWLLFKNHDYEYIPFVVAFAVSLAFFILPSSLAVSFKDFKIEIKD